MSDSPSDLPDRAGLDLLREQYLGNVRVAFAKAQEVIQSFRDLSAQHPDDVELAGLTEILRATIKQLLNTVTCKVAANGIAADWDRLFGTEGEHDAGERTSSTATE